MLHYKEVELIALTGAMDAAGGESGDPHFEGNKHADRYRHEACTSQ